VALGLVVHELATNAVKYGSLSAAKGHVSLTWAVNSTPLVIAWQESNGPAVKKPARQGFGTELIDREVRTALGGTVSLDYASAGLRAALTIPANADLWAPQPSLEAGPEDKTS
jgi:two-component sensor histidine kinase